MKTLGIDLASQDENTALCLIRWDEIGSDTKLSLDRPILIRQ